MITIKQIPHLILYDQWPLWPHLSDSSKNINSFFKIVHLFFDVIQRTVNTRSAHSTAEKNNQTFHQSLDILKSLSSNNPQSINVRNRQKQMTEVEFISRCGSKWKYFSAKQSENISTPKNFYELGSWVSILFHLWAKRSHFACKANLKCLDHNVGSFGKALSINVTTDLQWTTIGLLSGEFLAESNDCFRSLMSSIILNKWSVTGSSSSDQCRYW